MSDTHPPSTTGIDLSLLDDSELVQLIREALEAEPSVESDWIEVISLDGKVTLRGRVGTKAEVSTVAAIVRDEIGVRDVSNQLLVDELHRGQAPDGAIESSIQAEEAEPAVGRPDEQLTASSDHLDPLDSDQTRDPQEAVERATPYSPPDHPHRIGGETSAES